MSNENPKPVNGRTWRMSLATAIAIVGLVATAVLGGVSIWQAATNRALESEIKRVDGVELKISDLINVVSDFKQTIMSQMSAQGTKLEGLEKRFDLHEAREGHVR